MKTILLLSVCLAVITAGAAIPSQSRIVGFSVTMNADGSVLLKGNGLRATLPTNVVSLANALLSYVSSSLGSLKPGSTVSVTLPITTSRNAISYLVNGNTFNITGLQQVGLRQAVEAVERLQTDAISFVSSTNSTTSAAVATLGTQLTSFTNSVATTGNSFGLVPTSLSNNIAAAHSPITGASSSFNGGNIVNLTQYLNTVGQSTQQLSQNLPTLFQDLQNNVQQTFNEQVDVATKQIYSASLGLAQRAGISDSIFKNNCFQKYNLLLQQPSVQVSRLNSCLLPEAGSLTKIQQLLDYLLAQVQTDATAITNNKLATCTSLNGACISSFFSAYQDLAQQTSTQLTLTNGLIATEARAISSRIRTCAVATVADINDIAQQIQTNFNGCLLTGQ
ncbi:conserved hypothetical protein [Culex quinquefasciatus]|uniref:Uncharacterized protein n=1 Tax=Culex quinquefasciatus TaxID=7176 RepID=B0X6B6_CULQU|nr:conserved hypothetical protein [Culex quinquefasciatus]|eukprot:XP_001865188.1 conserved hypothetical protein [Culex quinquefasciatus]